MRGSDHTPVVPPRRVHPAAAHALAAVVAVLAWAMLLAAML
jgi:hypothetical protein